MAEFSYDNRDDIISAWDHPIEPVDGSNLADLLGVLASENGRLDVELDELYDNRFLGTATGNELEKIGELVGVMRKTDEKDEKLRKRIRGAFAAKSSDTTYDSFAASTMSILDARKGEVTFITPPDTGEKKLIEVQIDGAVSDRNPLTENEIVVLLNGAVSADAKVTITKTGTFAFAGDDASLEGFDEGTWSIAVN